MKNTILFASVLALAIPQLAMAGQQRSGQKIHDQETTYVQASPLKYSESQKMRDARLQMEAQTQREMMAELERARIAEERAQRARQQAPQVIASQPAPRETMEFTSPSSDEGVDYYISLGGGLVDHATVNNITGQGAFGASVGALINKKYAIEGTFLYSNLESSHGYCLVSNSSCSAGTSVDVLRTNSVDHYGLGAVAKYYLDFGSRFVPHIGLAGIFSYREHYPNDSEFARKSQAFDAGPTIGADFVITENVRVSLDWRYMLNLTYESEGTSDSRTDIVEVPASSDVEITNFEATEYQVWMASLKYLF